MYSWVTEFMLCAPYTFLCVALPILSSSYFAFDDEGDNITYSIPENGLGLFSFDLKQTSDGFNIYFKDSVNIDREVRPKLSYRRNGEERVERE